MWENTFFKKKKKKKKKKNTYLPTLFFKNMLQEAQHIFFLAWVYILILEDQTNENIKDKKII